MVIDFFALTWSKSIKIISMRVEMSELFDLSHQNGIDTRRKPSWAANVAFAMARDDIRPGFLEELKKIVGPL